MKRLRWQILVVFVTLLVVAILLISQQPVSTPILSQPTSGGIYTEALVGKFGRLNPVFDLYNSADRDIDRLIYSGLIRFDALGNPRPDLAESWGVTQDGTVYNIAIRSNALWQDGQPVTSDDVLFTLSILRSQFSTWPDDVRAMWDQIEITRLNNTTIKFTLPEPFAPFLDYLTFGILPRHLLESLSADQLVNADFNLHPVGSGPYKLDHLIIENGQIAGVVLAVFEDYFGQKPFIEQVVFRFYDSTSAALSAYQEGEVLGINQVTPDILTEALANPNLSIYSSRLPQISLVILNLNNPDLPFFQDKTIRRALLMGLNRQWMLDHILQGQAVLVDSPILSSTWAYYTGLDEIAFDPESAIALLKAAGYVLPADGTAHVKDNISLAFTLVHSDDELHTSLASAIQSDWAALGIQVTLQAVTFDQLLADHLTPRNFDAALVDLDMSRSRDPDPYPFWHQSESVSGQNYSQWDNRSASEYLEQARVLADQNTRTRLYRNFQVIFSKELPALLLYSPVYTYGVDARLRGVQVAPMFDSSDRFNTISDWYLVTRRVLELTQQPASTP